MLRFSIAVVALAIGVGPAFSQVEMQANQLDQHADVVRQRMLLHSTLRHRRGSERPSRATRGQKAACASKRRFRAQYGAGNAEVRRLYSLCRGVGL